MTLYIFDRWPVINKFSRQICLVSENINLSQHPFCSSIVCECTVTFVMVCLLRVMSSCSFISCFFQTYFLIFSYFLSLMSCKCPLTSASSNRGVSMATNPTETVCEETLTISDAHFPEDKTSRHTVDFLVWCSL